MTRSVAVLCVALSSLASGQDLPLPTALLTAKSAVVVNAGVDRGAFDRLVTELRALGRFELVADAATADLTIAIEGRSKQATIATLSGPRTVAANQMFLSMTSNADQTMVYSALLAGGWSVKTIIRGELERLDKRIRQQIAQQR